MCMNPANTRGLAGLEQYIGIVPMQQMHACQCVPIQHKQPTASLTYMHLSSRLYQNLHSNLRVQVTYADGRATGFCASSRMLSTSASRRRAAHATAAAWTTASSGAGPAPSASKSYAVPCCQTCKCAVRGAQHGPPLCQTALQHLPVSRTTSHAVRHVFMLSDMVRCCQTHIDAVCPECKV